MSHPVMLYLELLTAMQYVECVGSREDFDYKGSKCIL